MTTWAFDVEVEDWDKFVCGAAIASDGREIVFDELGDVADWYETLPSSDEVIAHNGGGFDFLLLISATPRLSWSASMAGSTIVSCQARGGARCRDTFRLFPLSLAKWTGQKTTLGFACECGRNCGGYCAIRRDMPSARRRELLDYNVNDARVLLRQYQSDVARLQQCGLDAIGPRGVRNTIGAVAWNTAAGLAGIDPGEEIEWSDYDAGRLAYYGGRTEVGRTHAAAGHRYDVHAMYPWALMSPVPIGGRRTLLGDEASRMYASGRLGIYHAKVVVRETDLPPLPHRYSGPTRGRLYNERLLWCTGHLSAWWTSIELQHAEQHGARIVGVDQAEIWDDEDAIFAPYVDLIYSERRRAIDAGDARWGAVLKWFANSLTGKLAQRPEVSRLVVIGEDDDPMEGWTQHGPEGSRVYSITTRKTPTCGLTWAAAVLTSRARVKLHERLARHSGRWLYCDTDSTYLIDADSRDVHPSDLGTWGYEGECRDWLALAPKLYRYRDETGAEHVRARGIPKASWAAIDALRDGATVTADGGVERIRSSGGRFVKRSVKRSWRDAVPRDGERQRCGTRYVLSDGTTRPLHRESDGRYV